MAFAADQRGVFFVPAVMALHAVVAFVKGERHVAVFALRAPATLRTHDVGRKSAAIEEQNNLLTFLHAVVYFRLQCA